MEEREIVIDYEPRHCQAEMHFGMESWRYSCIVAHRRCGKTVAVINHLIKQALLCTLPNPRYGYLAPLYSQAKTIAWDYLKHFTLPIPGVKRNESELWVELPNGARIRLFGADNPDNLRGLYFDGIVLDEVAQMKPEVWGEIVRPAIADRKGFVVFIGTPKGKNLFSDIYREALRDPEWYVGMFRASATNVLDAEELGKAARDMAANQYAQEFECDFSVPASKQFIENQAVEEARRRTLTDRDIEHAPVILSLDPAWSGDDEYVIGMRRGLDFTVLWAGYQIQDDAWLAHKLAAYEDEHKADAVFIDFGYGTGVYSFGKMWGRRWHLVAFGSGSQDPAMENKRGEMWNSVRKWLQEGGSIPEHDKVLADDLIGPWAEVKPNGKILLEAKENMKKRGIPSPNRGDALALTFAAPVMPKGIQARPPMPPPQPSYRPLGRYARAIH